MNDQSDRIRVCHVVASINQRVGGVAYSVSSLIRSLNGSGVKAALYSLNYREHGDQLPIDGALHFSPEAGFLSRKSRGLSSVLFNQLQQSCRTDYDLLHNHGLWMAPNYYARIAAERANLPLITSVRGMLESWSLGRSRLRKSIAWHLYERKNLNRVALFHATSEEEANSIRRLGFKQPIAVIPNGVESASTDVGKDPLEHRFPQLKGKRWLLFLSRIDRKKGLEELLRVWSQIREKNGDWHLVIAGPDLLGWQSVLEDIVEQRQLSKSCTFTGMLTGNLKHSAFAGASLFVLPTHSENFGIVVAEALSHGTPAITTREAPWQILEETGSGWWIENTEESLENTLSKALQMSERELSDMGVRGKTYVEQNLAWNQIASSMEQVYEWVLDRGTKPDLVQVAQE